MAPTEAAVVTGAGTGIGRALAERLAELGYAVGLQGRSEAALEATKRGITDRGGRALCVPGDVTREASASELIERTESAFGALKVAVANAGIVRSLPIVRTQTEDIRAQLEVNVVGAFHLLKASALAMINKATAGRIVLVGSTASIKGMRYTSGYCASKHALLGLARCAALELAPHGITVNVLCPGWVDTPMLDAAARNIAEKTHSTEEEAKQTLASRIPLKSVLEPHEVAALLSYVVSDAAAKLTGQALVIDGGESL